MWVVPLHSLDLIIKNREHHFRFCSGDCRQDWCEIKGLYNFTTGTELHFHIYDSIEMKQLLLKLHVVISLICL